MIFKSLSGLVSSYISDLLTPYTPALLLALVDLQTTCYPQTPGAKLETEGGKAFDVRAPQMWNNHSTSVKKYLRKEDTGGKEKRERETDRAGGIKEGVKIYKIKEGRMED